MKKHLISCLMLSICYCELFGQEINSSISVSHLSGTGKINNAWGISMTIDLIPRIDYSASGCISKHYNQIAGKYQYDKQDESIFLLVNKLYGQPTKVKWIH